mmetsp:Transcript_36950/g.47506  ORF Transcript_36950/g.47506 Transcript_36950/m.47506 type:complete len:104 (-) Transcript_36950:834-1145(-)
MGVIAERSTRHLKRLGTVTLYKYCAFRSSYTAVSSVSSIVSSLFSHSGVQGKGLLEEIASQVSLQKKITINRPVSQHEFASIHYALPDLLSKLNYFPTSSLTV